jgi:hypothetical protein
LPAYGWAGSVQKDVTFMEEAAPTIHDQIDAAYRTKYHHYVANIISSSLVIHAWFA